MISQSSLIRLFVIAVLVTLPFTVYSQTIPVTTKAGKVSVEECALTTYPADTLAPVVVLWDNDEVIIDINRITGAIIQERKRIQRIKVLKEEGMNYADGYLIISTDYSDRENIDKLSVTTYNLEDGKVVATKAPKSSIIRTMYNENSAKISFAAQNVKVGSVIEVSYVLLSGRFNEISDHYFQRDVPVNLSEYTISIPDWLLTGKSIRGFCGLEHSTDVESSASTTNQMFVDKYRAVDLPALKSESMVYCTRQYRTAVSYEISVVNIPGFYKDFSSHWTDVAELIKKSEIFDRLKTPCQIKDEVNAVSGADMSDIERIAAVVNLVREKIQWNREVRLIPGKFSEVRKVGSGNSADINAFAGSALSCAGYRVSPILVKMRSSGILQRQKPTYSEFDTFILGITAKDGTRYVVDAADPSGYVNVINDEYLNADGFEVVYEQGFNWVDLSNLCKNSSNYIVNARLTPEGTIEGSMSVVLRNNVSYDFKDDYRSYSTEDEFLEHLEQELSIEIESAKFGDIGQYSKDSKFRLDFSKENDCTADKIFINPFLIFFQDESAFRQEKRKLPIDFPYRESIQYSLNLEIPEGYVVEHIPESVVYQSDLPSKTILKIGRNGNSIQLFFKYTNDSIFSPADNYESLRKYWGDVSSLYKQIIIVKKS